MLGKPQAGAPPRPGGSRGYVCTILVKNIAPPDLLLLEIDEYLTIHYALYIYIHLRRKPFGGISIRTPMVTPQFALPVGGHDVLYNAARFAYKHIRLVYTQLHDRAPTPPADSRPNLAVTTMRLFQLLWPETRRRRSVHAPRLSVGNKLSWRRRTTECTWSQVP